MVNPPLVWQVNFIEEIDDRPIRLARSSKTQEKRKMLDNNKTYISELKNNVDKEVTLAGWLYNSRASGKIQFLILRDCDKIKQVRV